jgi:hypothetical protein
MKLLDGILALVVVATVASTCRDRDYAGSGQAASRPADAAAPTIASELVAFRSGITAPPNALAGPRSRDSLVRLFERALANRDTAGLDRLQITREEFAYLYYPESRMARPPYELGPDVMWMQIQSQRERGLQRLVAKYGGKKLHIQGLECQPADRQNAIVIHQCAVRARDAADTTAKQLFGSIIERDGRFKFVGYANRL